MIDVFFLFVALIGLPVLFLFLAGGR